MCNKSLTIIVPCFNEEEAIGVFYQEVTKVLCGLPYDYTILFVNDGSKDGTLAFMKQLAQQDEHVKYLSFSRNFGKEAAMYAGFCNAHSDYTAVMDVDLQDPPECLPEMLKVLESGEYDSVAARRGDRKGEPPVRSFFSDMFYKIINRFSDADIMPGARDFRLMKRDMVDAVLSMCEYNRFSKGIFGWIGFRTYWMIYENHERSAGKSKWNFWKLMKYALEGIINFSQAPLSFVSGCGLFITVVSFVMLIFIIVRRLLFGDPVAGWASTVCVVIFIGGIQLLCLGVIGQYISKMYLEIKNRPHFIISDTNAKDVIKIK